MPRIVEDLPGYTTTPNSRIFGVNERNDTGFFDLGEYSVASVQFDLEAGLTPVEGQLTWDAQEETLSLGLCDSAALQIGQEIVYHVINQSGSDIPNGTPLQYDGTNGNSGKISVAPWDGTQPSETFLGFATEDIGVGETGHITWFGKVRGIQTNGADYDETWEDGDIIYASDDGKLTKNYPTGPNPVVFAAVIINAHPSNGVLFSRPSFRTKMENGFDSRTDNTISFNEGNRTFTISPVGDRYSFVSNGTRFTKTSSASIQIPDSEGLHYFYWDGSGTLTTTQTFSDLIITTYSFIALVYWDATNNAAVTFADERHGNVMDSQTHLYNHYTTGTRYGSGLQPTDITADGNGSLSSHAQIGVSSGVIWDEDIEFEIGAEAFPASIPFWYKTGADGLWRKIDGNNYVVTNAPGGLPYYNEWTGATWQLTEVSNAKYLLMHLYATDDVINPLVWILGEKEYNSSSEARAGATTEILSLATEGLPIVEYKTIASFIVQCSNAYSNIPKARILSTDSGADYVDWRFIDSGISLSVSGAISQTLDDLTNVVATSPTDASVIVYDTGTATWNNVTISGDVTITNAGVATVANDSHTHDWSNITATPTTVSGYGITDAVQEGDSVTLTGDVSGTATFDTNGNVSITTTVANDSHTHTWSNITDTPTTVSGYGITNAVEEGDSVTLTGDVTGTATFDANGDVSIATTVANNAVALGTDTTGNYVATIAGTTNQVTVTGSGSESAAVTLSLPQDIHTGASPTFAGLTIGTDSLAEYISDTVGAMVTSNTESGISVTYQDADNTLDFDVGDFSITLTGDVTGTGTVTNLGNVSFATTIAADSVALGTNTTGNYVAQGVTSGNGISGSVNSEGGTFTVVSNATDANTPNTIVFRDASGNFSAGTITATATTALYADLAERYVPDKHYGKGWVLAFGGEKEVTLSDRDSDTRIAGVVTTAPAHLMNTGIEGVDVALVGRVPCLVDGRCQKGDLLVSNGKGMARVENRPVVGSVIGRAMEDNSYGVAMIEVAVGRC